MKRNKRFWLVLVLLLIGVGVVYIAVSSNETTLAPPLPTVKIGSVTADVEQSTYCWEDNGSARCEDHGLPTEEDLQLIQVDAGDAIDVTFHETPRNFSFNQVVDGELVATEQVVPDEPGVYLYETGGEWEKGDSRYVFGIRVR